MSSVKRSWDFAFKWLGPVFGVELAFVILDIAYVQHNIMTSEAFYTLIGAAFVLNLLVPITVKLWRP